jgi:hypothetical protein
VTYDFLMSLAVLAGVLTFLWGGGWLGYRFMRWLYEREHGKSPQVPRWQSRE